MEFIKKYFEDFNNISSKLDFNNLESMVIELAKIKAEGGRLFIVGVGGSAGNSSHAVNDFRKLAGIESYSPVDNISELTARINDEGWDTSISEWLKASRMRDTDGLLVLSVGGGDFDKNVSVNLCNAIDYANSVGGKVMSIVGRNGGYAAQNSTSFLVIPTVNEEFVTPFAESYQAVIWHLFVSHPKLKSYKTKW